MLKTTLFIGAIAAGPLLYRFRCRKPFFYGVAEMSIGTIIIYFVMFPIETHYLLVMESPLSDVSVQKFVGIAAGIYVLVRGLDNMSRDLPSSWMPSWERFFCGKK